MSCVLQDLHQYNSDHKIVNSLLVLVVFPCVVSKSLRDIDVGHIDHL